MQTQHHNTAMRDAFIKAEHAASYAPTNAQEPLRREVVGALRKGSGTRSKAMWAPLNPVAYNPSCLAVKEPRHG